MNNNIQQSAEGPPKIRNKTNVKSLKKNFPKTWPMTSRDYHDDPDARLDFIISRLKDGVTWTSFRNVIDYNRHLFVNRKVLVLHCGLDILISLCAAKAGAEHVYAIDTSNVVEYLNMAVTANKLNDKITILQGEVQEIELPTSQVDIIICNWMGHTLLHESKLNSMIYARDKWLKPVTGIIFPDRAQLYVTGIENSVFKHEHVDFWRNVHGFNMSFIRSSALIEPCYLRVAPSAILTAPVKIMSINLNKATMQDLKFRTPFCMEIQRCGQLEGVLTFFDVQFSKSHTPMGLSTSPWADATNWLQTVFYFDEPLSVNIGDKFYCGIAMNPSSSFHSVNIRMDMFSGVPDQLSLTFKMNWWLGPRVTELSNKSTSNSTDDSNKNSSTGSKSPQEICIVKKNMKKIIATDDSNSSDSTGSKSPKEKKLKKTSKKICAAIFSK